jgi:hypothetical protein
MSNDAIDAPLKPPAIAVGVIRIYRPEYDLSKFTSRVVGKLIIFPKKKSDTLIQFTASRLISITPASIMLSR